MTVADADGKTIGVGKLSGGTIDMHGITFDFTVTDVPDADIYSIEVTNRGAVKFKRADMAANDWAVSLTIS